MDWLFELLLGIGGVAIAALLVLMLTGIYFLRRSSRKLGETT
jgi:hypothetical protein